MTDPIKAKLQELCPDVMELKFGCEIEKDGEVFKLAMETVEGVFENTLEGFRAVLFSRERGGPAEEVMSANQCFHNDDRGENENDLHEQRLIALPGTLLIGVGSRRRSAPKPLILCVPKTLSGFIE
jgi:hypothetical protein